MTRPPPRSTLLSLHDALPIWLEEGAQFFVCGDAHRMAKDVDAELHAIIEKEGGKTPEQAAEYIESRSEEHTSELQSRRDLVCRLLLEKKKKKKKKKKKEKRN